jgi:signal transduction histidine kinase
MRLRLRTQLTLLYAIPFGVSGAALLTIPLLGANQTSPAGSNPASPADDVGDPTTHIHPVLIASAIGLLVMIVVAIGLGYWIAGRFLRPLRTITATAQDISASNLHQRLGLRGHDEFVALAATLDDLFERLEASFESQRNFVANASHELRTPLTAERALLQVALADPEATVDTLRTTCHDLVDLSEHQERLIDALLTLASTERGIEQCEPVDLARIVTDTVDTHQTGVIRATLNPATMAGDPRLIESLVANLIENALRHNVPGGWVSVDTSTLDGRAHLRVGNSGPVIQPDDVERLFQPFQRLEGRVRRIEGHGLGLAIVRAIATAHGASLAATARPEGGLSVEVTFEQSTVAPGWLA